MSQRDQGEGLASPAVDDWACFRVKSHPLCVACWRDTADFADVAGRNSELPGHAA